MRTRLVPLCLARKNFLERVTGLGRMGAPWAPPVLLSCSRKRKRVNCLLGTRRSFILREEMNYHQGPDHGGRSHPNLIGQRSWIKPGGKGFVTVEICPHEFVHGKLDPYRVGVGKWWDL